MQKSTIVSKKELSNISFSFERGGQNENESFGKKSRNIHQVQQKTNESKKKNEKRKERARKIVEVTNAPTTNQNQYSICRIQAVWVDGGHDVSIPNPNSNELKQWTESAHRLNGANERTEWAAATTISTLKMYNIANWPSMWALYTVFRFGVPFSVWICCCCCCFSQHNRRHNIW